MATGDVVIQRTSVDAPSSGLHLVTSIQEEPETGIPIRTPQVHLASQPDPASILYSLRTLAGGGSPYSESKRQLLVGVPNMNVPNLTNPSKVIVSTTGRTNVDDSVVQYTEVPTSSYQLYTGTWIGSQTEATIRPTDKALLLGVIATRNIEIRIGSLQINDKAQEEQLGGFLIDPTHPLIFRRSSSSIQPFIYAAIQVLS